MQQIKSKTGKRLLQLRCQPHSRAATQPLHLLNLGLDEYEILLGCWSQKILADLYFQERFVVYSKPEGTDLPLQPSLVLLCLAVPIGCPVVGS